MHNRSVIVLNPISESSERIGVFGALIQSTEGCTDALNRDSDAAVEPVESMLKFTPVGEWLLMAEREVG